jgi:hypothetical protein
MKHLFNRAYLTADMYFGEFTKRIIVNKDYNEIFVNQNKQVAERLEDPDEIGTIINTNDNVNFIDKTLPSLLSILFNIKDQFRFFCDDESYIKIYTFFLKGVFKSLTFSQYIDLIKINMLERMPNDRIFFFENCPYQEKTLRHIFSKVQLTEESLALFKENIKCMSLEFRMLAVLADHKNTGAKQTILKLVKEKAARLITSTQRDVVIMGATGLFNNIVHYASVPMDGKTVPTVAIKGVEELISFPVFDNEVNQESLKNPSLEKMLSQMDLVNPHNAKCLRLLLPLIAIEDEKELVQKFIDVINKSHTLLDVFPLDMEKKFSPNALMWGIKELEKNNLFFNL